MGICASLSGIGLGCLSIVLQPILCAYGCYQLGAASHPEEPVSHGCGPCACGLVGGAVCGVVCGAVSAAVGLCFGVTQVVLGICHTPGTILARLEGKEWDDRQEEWNFYNLKEEAALVLNMNAQSYIEFTKSSGSSDKRLPKASVPKSNSSAAPSRVVKETALYEALGVGTQATAVQIKKAYFKLAKECHPDKNPGDPNATKHFQEISDAYQVLSDSRTRAKYDAEGRDGLVEHPQVDAKEIYAQIFGSEKFEKFIGQMAIVTMLEMGEEDSEEQLAQVSLAQWQREVTCAVNLVQLLDPFVSESVDEQRFRQSISDLGKNLSADPMGGALLSCIGRCYQQMALRALGSSNVSGRLGEKWTGMLTSCSDMRRSLGEYVAVGRLMMQFIENYQSDQADVVVQQDVAKTALHLWWQVTVMEIETTLEAVCTKVTHDTSVEKDDRRRRAVALSIVGEEFSTLGSSSEDAMDSLTARLGT